jgi:hypothetical protein
LRESQQPIRETIFRGEDGLRFVIGLVMHACVHPNDVAPVIAARGDSEDSGAIVRCRASTSGDR